MNPPNPSPPRALLHPLLHPLLYALALTCAAGVARAEDTWSTPFSGVSYLHRTGPNQLSAHAVLVDLCAPGVGVRHTAFAERERTASSFAQLTGAQVVINGDWSCRPIDVGANSPFPPCQGLPRYHTYGVAAHAGEPWPSNWSHDALLAFAAGRVEMYDYNEHKQYAPWMQEAMSGHFQLVRDGAVSFEAATGVATDRPPRSAIGLSEDRTHLVLVAVDGRRSYRGMNEAEIAAFLVELGAHSAFGLDGGGSSTLWMQSRGVVNDPSDGSERVVGPHLGVFASGQGNPTYCDRPWETHPSRPLPAIERLGPPGGFFPRAPVRVYDTRNAAGSQHLVGLQRGADQKPVAQGTFGFSRFSAHGAPSDASAVAMNLTVANQSSSGFVTAWPGHLARPDTSNLNHGPVQATANSALIHINATQEMKLYSYASAQHLGDLTGWFAPGGAGLVPRTPQRVLDTRSSGGLASGESRQVVPAPTDGATAVALGVTALSAGSTGFLTLYPCHQSRPDTSTVNFAANDVVSGSILVPTGPQGVCAYSYGQSNLLVDHFGSFIPNQGAEFQAVRPARLIDTRSTTGRWVGRVPHDSVQQLTLSDIPGFPSDAEAIAVNLTAVSPAANGFAALGPCDNRGNASSVNYREATTRSTTSVVKINSGRVCLYVYGRTHILIDLVGVFVPPPDPCRDQPCLNGARCVSGRADYTCECLEGFSGARCGQNIDDCQGAPCLNGGRCVDGVAQYTCECPQGFVGARCEQNVDDCGDDPCQNGGVCVDEVGGYRCECPEAFSGAHCEVNIDDCAEVRCEHGGLCVDLVGDFRCDCPEGFEGERCEQAPAAEDMGAPEPVGGEAPPPMAGVEPYPAAGVEPYPAGGAGATPVAGVAAQGPEPQAPEPQAPESQAAQLSSDGCAQGGRPGAPWAGALMFLLAWVSRRASRAAL